MARKSRRSEHPVKPNEAAPRRFWPYGFGIFAVLLFLDQYTKYLVVNNLPLGQPIPVVRGLWLTYIQNTGISWGMFPGANMAVIWLSIMAFGLLVFFFDKFETLTEKIAYTLIMVGLWGNLLDRGVHGFVVDFIDLGWWPVFNIADSCITIAVVMLISEQLFRHKAEKKAAKA